MKFNLYKLRPVAIVIYQGFNHDLTKDILKKD